MNKKTILLQRFLIILCPVLLLVGGWNLLFNNKIQLEKFNKVEASMDYEEVVNLIGRGKETVGEKPDYEHEIVYEYQIENDIVGYISFWRREDGTLRVSGKETSFSQEKLSWIKIGMSLEEVEARIGPGENLGSYSTYYYYELKEGNYCNVGYTRDDADGIYYVSYIEICGRE